MYLRVLIKAVQEYKSEDKEEGEHNLVNRRKFRVHFLGNQI
jgi:hypothetical protein